MKITPEMIRPELRLMGGVIRKVMPVFDEKGLRSANKMHRLFSEGRSFSLKVNCEQVWLDRPDGSKLRVCVYTGKKKTGSCVGLLWMHGGGYGLGLPEQDIRFIENFIAAADCVVVAPDYRKSVDAPYPAALEDCYQALLWMRDNCGRYNIRSNQLFVGGDSAGGGLAAAVSLYARDRGEVSIAFQMPLYPMIDDRMITESSQDNDAPVWNSKSNLLSWKLYLGELYGSDSVPIYAAPARADDLSDLPPTLTFVGGLEPFRDETIEFVRKLRASGVRVAFRLYKGCYHAFDIMRPNSKVGKSATGFLLKGFRYAVRNFTREQPKNCD
ncbi:MAG: alpha/beta hydrolase [Oscillospiraceae bacterium]|nr:alpha/beta hydrolase [Oscillospiraceae bacterium]